MVINRFPSARPLLNYPGRLLPFMARLSDSQVDAALKRLEGWRREGGYIVKDYRFRSFPAGIRFVDKVALTAEAQEHHPDIHVVWTTVTLKITTHDEGGLTEWDVELAKAIDRRPPRRSKPR